MTTDTQQLHPSEHTSRFAKIETVVRLLLGAFLAFSSLNFWLNIAPPPEMPEAAQKFFAALAQTGYFLVLLKVTELVVATALLTNRFVPLALIVLAPITINILLFHAVLDPGGMGGGFVLLVLHLTMAWSRRQSYRDLLKAR